jgi:large subunit ribosomal protein L23
MRAEDIIKRPLILTEKGNRLRESENQYLFEVARDANKAQIRGAVEALWKVSVLKVHTLNVRGRMRRMGRGHAKTQNWKKAIVSLKDGDRIDFFEGT